MLYMQNYRLHTSLICKLLFDKEHAKILNMIITIPFKQHVSAVLAKLLIYNLKNKNKK